MYKSTFLILMIAITLGLVACNSNEDKEYWVLDKSRVDEIPKVEKYVKKIQQEPTNRGFKVFTISEGKKMIVLSLGKVQEGYDINVSNVDINDAKTTVEVGVSKEQSYSNDEKNPYILIGLNEIKGDLIVKKKSDDEYAEIN